MGELDSAIHSYEQALRFNQWSIPAMQAISCILRTKDQFAAAVEYLKTILKVEPNNGEVWGSLGSPVRKFFRMNVEAYRCAQDTAIS